MHRRWFGGDAKGSIRTFGLKPGASAAVYTTDRLYVLRHRTNLNEPMSENEKSQDYDRARAAFDALKMDERAAFLVESVVAMLAEGVGEAGRVVSEVIDEMARNVDACCDDDAGTAPGADAAPTAEAKGTAKPSTGKASAKTGPRRAKRSAPASE